MCVTVHYKSYLSVIYMYICVCDCFILVSVFTLYKYSIIQCVCLHEVTVLTIICATKLKLIHVICRLIFKILVSGLWRCWVHFFGIVGIVFSSSFHWYYIHVHGSKMFITHKKAILEPCKFPKYRGLKLQSRFFSKWQQTCFLK